MFGEFEKKVLSEAVLLSGGSEQARDREVQLGNGTWYLRPPTERGALVGCW